MEVFWRNGFRAASIEDIVQASGLNRYALYSRIGGKKELFVAALDRYHQERKAVFVKALNDPDAPPLSAIRDVLEFAVSEMAARRAGCLMCNVATQVADHDPDIRDQVGAFLDEIEHAYLKALTAAEGCGQLKPGINPAAAAKLLITLMFGLGVHARNGAPLDAMQAQIDTAMDLLGDAGPQRAR